MKALHECGHGFATKVLGGEVHEAGIILLALMPVPYVDASAASAFRSKGQRVLVGAGGMLVELFLASLALFVWLLVEPGPVRAVAWNVMLIGGVSTLVFNANPLLRFDGYYILADAIDIPNLGSRANAWLGWTAERHLGVGQALVGVGMVGVQLDCRLTRRHGLLQLAMKAVGKAELAMRIGALGIERHGPLRRFEHEPSRLIL